MAISLKHATKAQVFAAWRARFLAARGLEAGRLAWLLRRWYLAGDVTNAQLAAVTGLSGTQLTAWRTRIVDMATRYEAARQEVGE